MRAETPGAKPRLKLVPFNDTELYSTSGAEIPPAVRAVPVKHVGSVRPNGRRWSFHLVLGAALPQ